MSNKHCVPISGKYKLVVDGVGMFFSTKKELDDYDKHYKSKGCKTQKFVWENGKEISI